MSTNLKIRKKVTFRQPEVDISEFKDDYEEELTRLQYKIPEPRTNTKKASLVSPVENRATDTPSPIDECLYLKLHPQIPCKATICGFEENIGRIILKFSDSDTIDRYKTYEHEVSLFFKDNKTRYPVKIPVGNITPGVSVFARFDKRRVVRAKVLNFNAENKKVLCKNLDTWEEESVAVDKIYYLPPYFLNFPFLMQSCKLKGIEFWCTDNILTEVKKFLPRISSTAEVLEYNRDEDEVPVISLQVRLQRVQKHKFDDGELMDLSKLFKKALSEYTLVPRLFYRGPITGYGNITHAETNGKVWMLMHSSVATKLANMGEEMPKIIMTSAEYNLTLETPDPMTDFEYTYYKLTVDRFLAPFGENNGLFRVQVVEHVGERSQEVKVHYLDYGNTEIIPVNELVPCPFVEKMLEVMPPQAFLAKLNGVSKIPDIEKFFEKIHNQLAQRMTVVGMAERDVPLLDLEVALNYKDPQRKWKWSFLNDYLLKKNLIIMDPLGWFPYYSKDGTENTPKPNVRNRTKVIKSLEMEVDADGVVAVFRIKKLKSKMDS